MGRWLCVFIALIGLLAPSNVLAIPVMDNLENVSGSGLEANRFFIAQVFSPPSSFALDSIDIPVLFQTDGGVYDDIILQIGVYETISPTPSAYPNFSVWGADAHWRDADIVEGSSIVPIHDDPIMLYADRFYYIGMFFEPNNIGHAYWQYASRSADWLYDAWLYDNVTGSWGLSDSTFGFRINSTPVPEPSSIAMVAIGLLVLIGYRQFTVRRNCSRNARGATERF